jgi:hypothetical protein
VRITTIVAVASRILRLLKNNEIRQFCEYRTQRLVLEAWDRLFGGWWVRSLWRPKLELI